MTYTLTGHNKSLEVPSEFAMPFMGSFLTFLIVMIVGVLLWMWINSLLGIRQELCDSETEIQHGRGQTKESLEDLESGNPMTYHPTFLTIRHSYLSHPLFYTHN